MKFFTLNTQRKCSFLTLQHDQQHVCGVKFLVMFYSVVLILDWLHSVCCGLFGPDQELFCVASLILDYLSLQCLTSNFIKF